MSTHEALPAPEILKEHLRSLAALDIIMIDGEDEYLRVHHFYPEFTEGMDMVKIDNGSGDHMYVLFSKEGTLIKGFDHESALSPYANEEEAVALGIYDDVPGVLLDLLGEETEREDVTFCLWRTAADSSWKKGDVVIPEDEDDGEGFLLGLIFEDAESWLDWAKVYYEVELGDAQLEAVEAIYRQLPVSAEAISGLNSARDSTAALEELAAIRYPVK
ncbi:MAG: hypothetical protein K0Q90_3687 [Paenibacillaceae bacterium]|jgi:hypothetical protein|nr:hypothetical protein [Paenibacillaceae bacterium]